MQLGGMFFTFAERPQDLIDIIDQMNSTARSLSQGFCGQYDDQAFGTYGMSLLNMRR
jgi:hypothetical protein